MTQKEIEEGIEELDKRVERLRAMYDQYFLGIERLEPMILRRDVERRFWGLRREKIRNTAVRFRFNMLIQRFTTYQTFWMRVARQIEEGTYRRDVMKVRQRLELQRHERKQERLRRMGELPEEEEGIDIDIDVDPDDGGDGYGDEAAWAAGAEAGGDADLGDVDDGDELPSERTQPRIEVHELAAEVRALTKAIEESQDPAEPSVLTFGAVPRARIAPEEEEETTSPEAVPPPIAPSRMRGTAPLGRIALRKVAPASVAPEVTGAREDEVVGVPRDAVEERVPPAPTRPGTPPAPQRPGASPPPPARPGAAPPAPARPGASPSPPVKPGASPPPPARPGASPPPPARPGARPHSMPLSPPPAPVAPPAPAPSPPPAVAAAPPERRGGTGDTDLRSLFLKRPRPTTGAAPAPAPAPAAKPATAPAPARGGGARGEDGLPEDRVRAIYDQYRATRRQNNEGDVAFESVKKSIGEMLPKLRQKAPGREVDFEVVVKDGKTVLKPVAK